MRRVLLLGLLAAALALVGSAVPAATACGFNEDIVDTGTVHVYLKCTQPRADVDPESEPQPP